MPQSPWSQLAGPATLWLNDSKNQQLFYSDQGKFSANCVYTSVLLSDVHQNVRERRC